MTAAAAAPSKTASEAAATACTTQTFDCSLILICVQDASAAAWQLCVRKVLCSSPSPPVFIPAGETTPTPRPPTCVAHLIHAVLCCAVLASATAWQLCQEIGRQCVLPPPPPLTCVAHLIQAGIFSTHAPLMVSTRHLTLVLWGAGGGGGGAAKVGVEGSQPGFDFNSRGRGTSRCTFHKG